MNKFSSILFLIAITQITAKQSSFQSKFLFDIYKDTDEYINTTTLIKSKGYPAEEHDILTDDGYILLVHRIPSSGPKPVVLLQHGLLDASSTWVMNFPDQSLGFILADAGFDVWMGNVRGNTYGLRHSKLNPLQDEFWDFSWSDMGQHDLPSMVNYILKITGQKDLIYIGHSQGTLIAFSQFGDNEDLASKIKLFVALGPVSTVKHIKSPVKYLADIGIPSKQQAWFKLFGKKDFLPSNTVTEWLADKLCNLVTTDRFICQNILFAFCGPSKYMNISRIPVYTTHDPAGTSVKNLAHFSQMVISGNFQKYDYGSDKMNILHYNQTTPPLYNLKNVKVPTALYWAENDWLADPIDVQNLRENLPNIVDDYNLFDWDHLDFLWATNAKVYLYDRVLALINKYIN